MDNFTLADLDSSSFRAQCVNARSNKKIFYKLINEEVINWIVWAEQHKDMLCNNGEDAITFNLVTYLKGKFEYTFFEVAQDSHSAGHADIHIKLGRYQWLGEAKLSSGSAYSLKGFHQLVNRYASGSPTCSEGSLFIYITNASAKKEATTVINEWKDRIKLEVDDIQNLKFLEAHEDRADLSLVTQHIHSTSGLPYKVHHYIVQLQHFPTDGQ